MYFNTILWKNDFSSEYKPFNVKWSHLVEQYVKWSNKMSVIAGDLEIIMTIIKNSLINLLIRSKKICSYLDCVLTYYSLKMGHRLQIIFLLKYENNNLKFSITKDKRECINTYLAQLNVFNQVFHFQWVENFRLNQYISIETNN